SAIFNRPRDLWPCRRLLGDRGGVREFTENLAVEASQEIDGFEILATAIFVGYPAAFRTAVVEIKHRGDRIDAKPVNAVPIEPEQRIADQEVEHFGAAVVVDQGSPIEMAALLGIGVLVECGAVEMREPVRIVWKMAGHPVEQNTKASAVTCV